MIPVTHMITNINSVLTYLFTLSIRSQTDPNKEKNPNNSLYDISPVSRLSRNANS